MTVKTVCTCDGCGKEIDEHVLAATKGYISINGVTQQGWDACNSSCLRLAVVKFCNSYQTGKREELVTIGHVHSLNCPGCEKLYYEGREKGGGLR